MIRRKETFIQEYLSDHHDELVDEHNIPHSNTAIPFIIDGQLTHVVEYDVNPCQPILIELTRVTQPIYLSTGRGDENGKS